MKNTGDTGSYTFLDNIFSQAVMSLSRVIGVKNITRPFWNRWRASLIGDETLIQFLNQIKSFDEWPEAAWNIIQHEEMIYKGAKSRADKTTTIQQLRRLSYLCHMAQWGCLGITKTKKELYKSSRDYYIEAERMAHGERFQRLVIPWKGKNCYANLNLPKNTKAPYPLIVILHGMDDTKEEHLSTIVFLQERGFAVLCIDGPGQGESLFLENTHWEGDYCESIKRAISIACEDHDCDIHRVGTLGISWGGMWSLKMAAEDHNIKAVYDLGGPIDARLFNKLPFFLKTKFCQVLGITNPKEIPEAEQIFSIKKTEILEQIKCPVRIVHGGKDPIVPLKDKEWLLETLSQLHPANYISLVVHKTGDHCCTGQVDECRNDLAVFFKERLYRPESIHKYVQMPN